ncbi:MAG: PA14 domain-containing protein [Anaerolineae bacterium]|nr:PA14 domain-containing protein [Anaerolineae bacterium]MDW8102726.1 PA14 domain-containing protein [Anaerolineae bacterium]
MLRTKIVFCLLFILPLTTLPLEASSSPHAWTGLYFNNPSLSGSPTLVRQDPQINFDWGTSSPDPSIPPDNFSARWFAVLNFTAGRYRFTVTVDDGVRFWVDGELLIDSWKDQPATTYTAEKDLSAGNHVLVLEYYERTGFAVVKLSWEKVTVPAPGVWHGEYFSNKNLSGPPVFTRQDPAINFDWGTGSPDPRLPADVFSIRWTADIFFDHTGFYTFYAHTDDGVKVWLDSMPLIEAWWDQSATTYSVTRHVTRGTHRLEVHYYENTGFAVIKFWWTPSPIPPDEAIIVDELSPGFTWGGPIRGRRSAPVGYGGHMFWTYNATYRLENYGIWRPSLPRPGYYEVFAFIPKRYANTTRARYRIFHAGQRHDRIINQALFADKWVSLGTYYFNARGNEFVFLGDNTGEPYLSRFIGFDAIKFVPR